MRLARWNLHVFAGAVELGLATAVGLSAACSGPTTIEEDPKFRAKSETGVEATIASVKLVSGTPHRYEVGILLARPAEGLRETAVGLSADTALGIQPRLLYVSDVADRGAQSGRMCDRPRVPHTCEIDVTEAELGGETKRRIKVLFEDQAYGTTTILLPRAEPMRMPAIVEPTATPAQNSTLDLRFEDVGADAYTVTVRLCRPYANDGINPCLDETVYELRRSEVELSLVPPARGPTAKVTASEGKVHLTSSQPLVFEESVDLTVEARRAKKDGEIEHLWLATATKKLPR